MNPVLNFHHLRIFKTVVDRGSHAAAAQRLHLSQPAVSMQLKQLEEAVGLPLFELVRRRNQLTEAGKLLYGFAVRIFNLEKEAEDALRGMKGLSVGSLRVGASTTPGIYLLPETLAEFQKRHPEIEIDLAIQNSRLIEKSLLDNEIDLGVCGQEVTCHPDIIVEPVIRDRLVVVAAPGHPLAGRPALQWTDLASECFIIREKGSGTREVAEERLAAIGITLEKVQVFNHPEAIKRAVMAGMGLAILSALAVKVETAMGSLVPLAMAEDIGLHRYLNLAYHREKHLMPAVESFADVLRNLDDTFQRTDKSLSPEESR